MQMSVATLCLTKKKSSTLSEIERLVAGKKGQSERRLMDDGISCSHFRGLSATVMPSSRNEILSEKYHRTESLMTKRKEKKKEIFFWRREKLNSCKSVDSAGENMKLCLFSSSHFHIHFCYLGDTRRQNSQRVTVGQWNFRDMWLLVCFSNWCALCVYLPPPIECFISDEILNFDEGIWVSNTLKTFLNFFKIFKMKFRGRLLTKTWT